MSKKGTIDKKDEIASLYKDLASLRATEDFEPGQEDYEKAVKVELHIILMQLEHYILVRLFFINMFTFQMMILTLILMRTFLLVAGLR